MSTLALIQILGGLWLCAVAAFLLLHLYRALVGLHEDDSLHLSAAEAGFETEQCKIRQQIATLDGYSFRLGIVLLATTVALLSAFAYGAVQTSSS